MKTLSLAVLLLTTVFCTERDVIDPRPSVPPPDRGCSVVVTNLGPVVICR